MLTPGYPLVFLWHQSSSASLADFFSLLSFSSSTSISISWIWNLRMMVQIRPSINLGFPSTMSSAPILSKRTCANRDTSIHLSRHSILYAIRWTRAHNAKRNNALVEFMRKDRWTSGTNDIRIPSCTCVCTCVRARARNARWLLASRALRKQWALIGACARTSCYDKTGMHSRRAMWKVTTS